MTTIALARKDGRITIAADTLTRFGTTLESAEYVANHDKIIRVGPAYLALTGHASLQTVVKSYFDRLEEPADLGSVDAIYETFRAMHGVLKEHYFMNPKEDEDDPFESTQLDGLIAHPRGIFGIYSLRSVQEYTRYTALGSGFGYALGAMHALWDGPASAEEMACAGIEAAAVFDDATAMPLTHYSFDAAAPTS